MKQGIQEMQLLTLIASFFWLVMSIFYSIYFYDYSTNKETEIFKIYLICIAFYLTTINFAMKDEISIANSFTIELRDIFTN